MTSEAARRGMTADIFYGWLRGVAGRDELVDGEPMMMAGATNRHDRIVRNALVHVGSQLNGQRCQPFTAGIFLVDPESPTVRLWRRDAGRVWIYERASGLEQVLDLPLVGLRLPWATLYAGLVKPAETPPSEAQA